MELIALFKVYDTVRLIPAQRVTSYGQPKDLNDMPYR